jgi:hypothetical protein
MTPEGKVKKMIDNQLLAVGAYKHKPVQNGMGEPALDYHVCHRGFYVGIEAKAPDGFATPRQIRTMQKIEAAGGSVFLVIGTEGDDMAQLIGWLMHPVPGFLSASAAGIVGRPQTFQPDPPYEDEPE